MRRFTAIVIAALLGSLISFGPASASNTLTAGGTSISWDSASFFEPSGCTQYKFNYSQSANVLLGDIEILNRFGDSIGSTIIFDSGSKNIQICQSSYSRDEGPFKLVLESTASGGGGSTIAETAISFQSRSGATDTPSPPAPNPVSPTGNTLTAGGTSISWDSASFFEPSGCTQYKFNYSQSANVLLGDIEILNRFGDSIGSTIIFDSGSKNIQICQSSYSRDEGPFKLVLESTASGGGGSTIAETAISFQSRSGATDTPSPPAPGQPEFQVIQRTLATFQGSVTSLTSLQRAQVKAAVDAAPDANKFICTGIRYFDQPMSVNVMVRKRAKAACDYAKQLNPNLSTWFQNKPTQARSYAGKVLLTIKTPSAPHS